MINDEGHCSVGKSKPEGSEMRRVEARKQSLQVSPPRSIRIDITPTEHVTALQYAASAQDRLGVTLVLAHEAGANQTSSFIVQFAEGLAARGIPIVTFNFLYSENGRRKPDRDEKLELCYRKVIERIDRKNENGRRTGEPLIIGGKWLGGRVASQIAAKTPFAIAGVIMLGYPLHPAGRPQMTGSQHLSNITAPMLFVQGTRDAFGTPDEIISITKGAKGTVDLIKMENGDHSFRLAMRSTTPTDAVHRILMNEISGWLHRKYNAPAA
jgi:uncharacterized protein